METAILAGGRSSRFGANKALADWFGAPLIAAITEKARTVTEKVFIISNDEVPYRFLDIPVYPDIYPGMGPLSGLHSALSHAASNRVMVLACDMPLLNTDLLRHSPPSAPGRRWSLWRPRVASSRYTPSITVRSSIQPVCCWIRA